MRAACFLWLVAMALNIDTSSAIEVSVSTSVFKGENSPYVEVSKYVIGNSVTFKKKEEGNAGSDLKQARVNVTMKIMANERVIQFDKYRLSSPLTEKAINFADVKRYHLENGSYLLEVFFQDEYNPRDTLLITETLEVSFKPGLIQFGDIQLLSNYRQTEEENHFVKHGIFMEALPFQFYGKTYDKLSFYTEVYCDQENLLDSPYIFKYAIHKAVNKELGEEVSALYKRRIFKPYDPVLMLMDIKSLLSGNYYLVLEIMDRQRNVLDSRKAFFMRANPKADYEATLNLLEQKITDESEQDFTQSLDSMQLRYSLKALVPLISQRDAEVLNIIIGEGNVPTMRRFLFNYYLNHYPQSPAKGYEKYMEIARAIDKTYHNGFGYGFETDRGYFFLKYGKPDDIQIVNDDPSAPPYEIWFYNKLIQTNQTNVKFVFYNPSLIDNGHVLLHSTARGEWNNPKWEVQLYRHAPNEIQGDNYIDATRMQDNWNRHARRFYDDF